MQTKHFIHDPTHLVNSALHSLTLINPSLSFDAENKIIYRRPTRENAVAPKVSIISGGGSGHEPAFAGFVGKGLLTASVAGTIFASPSAEQVRRAILSRVPTQKGVFVITMNYTGDVLNFGMAAEKAKAAGIQTEFFAIGDDAGVGREKGGKVGRRGIGGGILVLKMCGALAELGGSLSEVYNLAQLTTSNIVSVGASLERVHVPGRPVSDASPDDQIPRDEIEIGMGIHNEPGSQRRSASLPELIKIILAQMLDPSDSDRAFVPISAFDHVVLFINNLGGVSTLEIGGITAEVHLQLDRDYHLKPVRVITGAFLTSLNGMGFSVSILKLTDTNLGPARTMLDLLDSPAEAIGWAAPIPASTWNADAETSAEETRDGPIHMQPKNSNLTLNPALTIKILTSGLKRLIASEASITHYDTITGDGDCGTGLKRGAEAILSELDTGDALPTDAVAFVSRIVPVVENNMDGTSGALYAIFLNSLVHGLLEQDTETDQGRAVDAVIWSQALRSSMVALAKYTPAAPGDRTLMDALVPFVEELGRSGNFRAAARKAEEGAESTKGMKAKLGRSVYVGGEEEWVGKIPDPGAWGLKELLAGMAEAMEA